MSFRVAMIVFALVSSADASSTPSHIGRVIQNHTTKLRACYQQELARDPRLRGTVVVRFTIRRDGSVSEAYVSKTTLESPRVEACVLRQIRKLVFPASEASQQVSYPFLFSAWR